MNKKITKFLMLIIIFLVILGWNTKKFNFHFYKKNLINSSSISTNVSNLLYGAYNTLTFTLIDQVIIGLTSITTDETMIPIRGTDWDDNGVWRVLHNHSWEINHSIIRGNYIQLEQIIKNTSIVIDSSFNFTEINEAKFIRDFCMFMMLDEFGHTPYYAPNTTNQLFAQILNSNNAIDFLINDIKSIIPNLPIGRGIDRASQDAARTLLIKLYLNKAVYIKTPRINFNFNLADINEVIKNADTIILSNRYSLNSNYFNNFSYNNYINNNELIFSLKKDNSIAPRLFSGTHYNQALSGWNGITTLSEFYDKFEKNDLRREQSINGFTNFSGMKVGFLYGQQYNVNGDKLNDRTGNLLFFTRFAKDIENGSEAEVAGIRILKYVPDYNGQVGSNGRYEGWNERNHFAVFRYTDVLLMKAEALLRDGNLNNDTTALTIVNGLRTHSSRNASRITTLSLDDILNERARELYTENWRRNDMIRFEKFLNPRWEKNYTSNLKYLLFPMADELLSKNPNLIQNPGY